MLLLLSVTKTYFLLNFSFLSLNNVGKFSAPFMEILFPMVNSFMERYHINPYPASRTSFPENVSVLPNNQYYMQTMGKVHNLQPFTPPPPGTVGDSVILKEIVIGLFDYLVTGDLMTLGKMSIGGGLVALQFFLVP